MAQTNPLQLDRVHDEGMRVIVGTIKDTPTETMRFMLDLPPMQTTQKVEHTSEPYFFLNSQLTPRSRKRHKGMQTGAGQVLDGSNRGLNTASMPADRGQVKQRTQYCKYAS